MPASPPQHLNNLFGLAGLFGFAIAWYFGGLYIATLALMALFTLHVVLLVLLRRMHKPTLFMWGVVMVLGGLTLLLRDKTFIQLKTSVVYGVFAGALLVADALGKNLPQLLLGSMFHAPAAVWRRVSRVAAGYFFSLSVCNYFVAKYFSEAVWVGVKTFGFPSATFLFTVLMIVYLYRYIKEEPPL